MPTASWWTSAAPATRSSGCSPRSTTGTSTRCRRSRGKNTTTEFLARHVFDGIVTAIGAGELGPGAGAVESIKVTLHESHVASASYEGRVRAAA